MKFNSEYTGAQIGYPEPAGQINLSIRMLFGIRMYRCCMCLLCYLYNSCLWCVSVWFTSTQDMGLWNYSQIWAGPEGWSQVKPAAWRALRLRGKLKQSTSGKRPRFICSSANNVLAAQVCTNQQTRINVYVCVQITNLFFCLSAGSKQTINPMGAMHLFLKKVLRQTIPNSVWFLVPFLIMVEDSVYPI
jgi:hypothetical protein